MIATMRKAILSPIPKDHVRQAARGLTWENYAHSIVQLLHAH